MESTFAITAEIFPTEGQKIVLKVQKWLKKFLFQRKFFHLNRYFCHKKCSFDKLIERALRKSPKNFSSIAKNMKINVFVYEDMFPKILFWHVESKSDNSVEQTAPNGHNFSASPEILTSPSPNRNNYQKEFFWTRRKECWQLDKEILAKGQKIFAQYRKNTHSLFST